MIRNCFSVTIIFTSLFFCFLQAQENDQSYTADQVESKISMETVNDTHHIERDISDQEVVTAILRTNNKMKWDINNVAVYNNEGRLISLNLNNREVGKEGIKILNPQIGLLTELKQLFLNDNDLTSLPSQLGELTKLEKLEIRNNSLISFPASIGKCISLKSIDIRSNQLEELPPEIGELKQLETLQLWGNKFTSLPQEIADCVSLKELYLRGNRLNTLPLSITKFKLKYIDVQDNYLCNQPQEIDKWLKKHNEKYESVQKCKGEKRFQ